MIEITMRQLKVFFFILCVLNLTIINSSTKTECDKTKCRGPTRYYEELRCTPLFETLDSCCPYQYDCNHLKERLPNKCYIGDSVYNINDDLAEHDTNPCDVECTCRKINDRARFYCSVVDCPSDGLVEGCYLRRNQTQCCAEVVCHRDRTLPQCMVDGEIYMSGEEFVPKSNPDQICQCYSSHSNEYAELLCRKNDRLCNSELYFQYNESCVPVYFPNESPQAACSFIYRCYNNNDRIIKYRLAHTQIERETFCIFGDLILSYGDRLTPETTYDTCMNCTCEVGPMLTCRHFPNGICDHRIIY
ncbi:uncharacterized protein [Chelonus insularis]|uniref:uncharacterized protein n=1 Tax=Chelonus insularis TaxID=460826 RepID=UPI00158D387E|nr:uncharacterized protein LOC118066774 [Chelonus insularis]